MGPVVCLERLADTLGRTSHPNGIRRADAWARRYRPEVYVMVLRPGLPFWLFNLWHRRQVPVIGVQSRGQLNHAHWSVPLLTDAANLCAFIHEEPTPEERDAWARSQGSVVTIDHVLQNLDPDA